MRFPQWNTQVYTQPMDTRLSTPQLAKPVKSFPKFHDTSGEKIALAILETGGKFIKGLAERSQQMKQAERAKQVLDAKVNAKKELSLFTQELLHDPDYLTYGDRYNEKQEEMLRKYTRDMDPAAADQFKTEFTDISTPFALKVQEDEIVKHKASVTTSIENYLAQGVQEKSVKKIEEGLTIARESGYFNEQQLDGMKEFAHYEYQKKVLEDEIASEGYEDGLYALTERGEDGGFVNFSWLKNKDRKKLSDWASGKMADEEKQREERLQAERDRIFGDLQAKLNDGELTNTEILARQDMWEARHGFVDQKTADGFYRLKTRLENEEKREENNNPDKGEEIKTTLQTIANLVRNGQISPEQGEKYVTDTQAKYPGFMGPDVYENYIEQINDAEYWLGEGLFKQINKDFDLTGDAVGGPKEGSQITEQLLSWKQSVEFDAHGAPTGKTVTEEELTEKYTAIKNAYVYRSIAEALGPERELMVIPGMGEGVFQGGRKKFDIGTEEEVRYKDILAKATEPGQTEMEEMVQIQQELLETGTYTNLTDEQKQIIRENSKAAVDDYAFWLKAHDGFWHEKKFDNRKVTIEWYKDTFPIFYTDAGSFMIRYNHVAKDYFAQVDVQTQTQYVTGVGTVTNITGLIERNPNTGEWERIE